MKPNPALKKFIAPYDEGIQKLTLELRNFITELVPQANELIWDNYNAVAMAYSKSEKLKDEIKWKRKTNTTYFNKGYKSIS